MNKNRVIIVEDDCSLASTLTEWLSEEYEVHGYKSAEKLLSSFYDAGFDDENPTCMLLDFQMPGKNGVELQEILVSMGAKFPIIFMSGNALQTDVIDAWRGGAIDFLLKPFTGARVSKELAKVFSDLAKREAEEHAHHKAEEIIDLPITKREAQVLLLLAKGLQQTEVATMLGIAVSTVKMFRTFLKTKLGLNNPIELSKYCDEYYASIKKIAEEE